MSNANKHKADTFRAITNPRSKVFMSEQRDAHEAMKGSRGSLLPRQQEAFNMVQRKLEGNNVTTVCASVSWGKSYLIARLAQEYSEEEGLAVVITDRKHLRANLRPTFAEFGLTTLSNNAPPRRDSVSILSKQIADKLSDSELKEYFGNLSHNQKGVILVDEGHRALSEGYKKLLDVAEGFGWKVVLFTGTPLRGDGRDVGQHFGVAYSMTLREATDLAIVSTPRIMRFTPESVIDLSGLKKGRDEERNKELATRINDKKIGWICSEIIANKRKDGAAIIFTPTISICERVSAKLKSLQPSANVLMITSNDSFSDRELESIQEEARAGNYDYLVNVTRLIEGFSVPCINTFVSLRAPSHNVGILEQAVGRAVRLYKDNSFRVLSFTSQSSKGVLELAKEGIDRDSSAGIKGDKQERAERSLDLGTGGASIIDVYATGYEALACEEAMSEMGEREDVDLMKLLRSDAIVSRAFDLRMELEEYVERADGIASANDVKRAAKNKKNAERDVQRAELMRFVKCEDLREAFEAREVCLSIGAARVAFTPSHYAPEAGVETLKRVNALCRGFSIQNKNMTKQEKVNELKRRLTMRSENPALFRFYAEGGIAKQALEPYYEAIIALGGNAAHVSGHCLTITHGASTSGVLLKGAIYNDAKQVGFASSHAYVTSIGTFKQPKHASPEVAMKHVIDILTHGAFADFLRGWFKANPNG